jgi:hypothetical protein
MFNARVLITSTALLIASPAGAQNPGINCKPSMPAQCAPDENGKERFVCHVRIEPLYGLSLDEAIQLGKAKCIWRVMTPEEAKAVRAAKPAR